MSFDNNSGDKSINYQRLEKLAEEIRNSYVRDLDKTQEMKEALEMLKDIN